MYTWVWYPWKPEEGFEFSGAELKELKEVANFLMRCWELNLGSVQVAVCDVNYGVFALVIVFKMSL